MVMGVVSWQAQEVASDVCARESRPVPKVLYIYSRLIVRLKIDAAFALNLIDQWEKYLVSECTISILRSLHSSRRLSQVRATLQLVMGVL
jgi:hypothetical protein